MNRDTKMISRDQMSLLSEILEKNAPGLIGKIGIAKNDMKINEDDRIEIIDLLTNELCESGLDKITSEPNFRGIAIEDLIDHFVRHGS